MTDKLYLIVFRHGDYHIIESKDAEQCEEVILSTADLQEAISFIESLESDVIFN